MEQAPYEKRIIQQCMRERLPLPQRIQNAPEVLLGLEIYFSAFLELNTCRPLGPAGVGPIAWSEIMDYARAYEFDDEQAEDLVFYIRAMDKAYLEWNSKNQTK